MKDELDALGIKVAAASVDPLDKAKEVADEVNFPVGYGVSRDIADALGSWYFPRGATGSQCSVRDWTDNGDGTLTLDYDVPPDSWILVTASTACAEGPAGRNSAGDERTTLGTWELYGAP